MPYTIMIVDDEPANVRALRRVFSSEYDVITAGSGAEALEKLQQEDVAVLITDQRMPEMTGIELLKRSVSIRPRMVRIILTGYSDIEALVEAINSGQVYKYVTKPWSNEDLKLLVRRALEHYENSKRYFELELDNQRLLQRLREIQQLASVTGATEQR